ncbi:MAG: DUF4037 domain-containing protein [Candidatus Thorarchaeota archaeon]
MLYEEIIKKFLEEQYPSLEYAAALIGKGSEVLNFDDEMSTDHHWGPRLQLFLKKNDYDIYKKSIKEFLSNNLPLTFHGYSTNWSEPDPNDNNNQFLKPKKSGPVNHRIEIFTVQRYLKQHLGLGSLNADEIDWFTIPEQKLLEFTSGRVFFDSSNDLTHAREILHYYPNSICKLRIIAQWNRIAQEIAFVGRIGGMGDDLGSRIEASRLVRYIMQMAFMLAKKFIPYEKWFGIAFSQLPIATKLKPILLDILKENQWEQREKLLIEAYLLLVREHIQLGLIPNIEIKAIQYHNRSQLIIPIQKIIHKLVKGLDARYKDIRYQIFGTINQFIDSSNLLDPEFSKKYKIFFD